MRRMRVPVLVSTFLLTFSVMGASASAQDAPDAIGAGVEVTDVHELMEDSTRERVQERLTSIGDRLGECFGEDPRVDILHFELSVDRDGAVTRLTGRDVPANGAETARCVRTLLQRLRFDPASTPLTFGIAIHAQYSLGLSGVGGHGAPGAPGRVHTGGAVVRGSLPRDAIRRVIRQHINRVRFCYERALAQDASLQGRITIQFIVAANGHVQSAAATSDTVGSGSVQSCVVQVVRTLRFPAPSGGGIVVVTYPFVFNPGRSAPSAPSMAPSMASAAVQPVVSPGRTTVRGSLDRSVIQRVMRRNQSAVRRCYERELQRAPNLAGRVTVRFEIAPTGRVASAQVAGDTLGNAGVSECIVREVRRWVFPQPEGGGSVTVSYPLYFREGFSNPPPTGQSPAGPPSEFERFALAASAGPRGWSSLP